jgi:hypothetical protein
MNPEEIREILTRGFAALDITREEVSTMASRVRASSTFQEANEIFEQFKARVKRLYREKALECHPDRGGNEEAFKEFGQLLHALDSITIGRQGSKPILSRPDRTVRVVVVHPSSWPVCHRPGSWSSTTGNPWGV